MRWSTGEAGVRGLGLLMLLVWLAPAAYAGEEVERGRAMAQRLCAHCHLGEGQGEKQGAQSIPGFRAVARRPGQTEEGVVQWLRSRPKMMPDHHLSIEEAYDLAAFILSLKDEK